MAVLDVKKPTNTLVCGLPAPLTAVSCNNERGIVLNQWFYPM